jgi:hypothetical protein
MFGKHLSAKCGNTKRVTWVSKHDENVTIQMRTFAWQKQILGKVQHGHAKVMGIMCKQIRDTRKSTDNNETNLPQKDCFAQNSCRYIATDILAVEAYIS